jgi:hypothetical protein
VPDVFPGEAGFSLLMPSETFTHSGKVTKCYYRFVAGRGQYVDKRDMPGLPRGKFDK